MQRQIASRMRWRRKAACFALPLLGAVLLGTSACATSSYMGISMTPGEASPEVQALAQRARSGDKHAQLDLGIRFEEGNGVPQDKDRAIKLYKQAASDSGGMQMMYVPRKGHVQAVPVHTGSRIVGLAESKQRAANMADESADSAGLEPKDNAGFDGPVAPFPPEELWRRLRELIIHYNGNITPKEVEKTFHINMARKDYEDGSGYYFAKYGEDSWYKSIGIVNSSDSRTNRFGMDWNFAAFHTTGKKIGLNQFYARKSLEGTDWEFESELNSYGTHVDRYSNGKYFLDINLHGDLVKGIGFGRMPN